MTRAPGGIAGTSRAEAYAAALVRNAAAIRQPELFGFPHRAALDQVLDRNGITVVALRTSDLTEEQLLAIMRFRLAQYLAIGFVNPAWAYERQTDHESLAEAGAEDVHIIAGSAATGEIVCYTIVKGPSDAAPGATLRTRQRPLFPCEQAHGWGVFNHLRELPDLPIARIRECGRFMKNQCLSPIDERGVRGPAEVLACYVRLLTTGALACEVDAIVGDFEETVLKRNFDFFHLPVAVVRGTAPYEPPDAYMHARYEGRIVCAAAASVADIDPSLPRLHAIESALERPGKAAVLALIRLKRDRHAGASRFDARAPHHACIEAPLEDLSLATA